MKRISILIICLATFAGAGGGMAAGAGATGRVPAGADVSGHRARLELEATGLGKILANGRGFTVYMFTRDRRNVDNCAEVSGCTGIWPPVTTSGKALSGSGVKRSLIGSIALGHGVRRVTYAGHPLYTYSADGSPGQTFYVGIAQFGGTWYAVNARGRVVR